MDKAKRKRIEKALKRFKENDRNVSLSDIDHLLDYLGFEQRMVGSHATYKREGIRPITIPFRTPHILTVYVKAVMQIIEEMLVNDESG